MPPVITIVSSSGIPHALFPLWRNSKVPPPVTKRVKSWPPLKTWHNLGSEFCFRMKTAQQHDRVGLGWWCPGYVWISLGAVEWISGQCVRYSGRTSSYAAPSSWCSHLSKKCKICRPWDCPHRRPAFPRTGGRGCGQLLVEAGRGWSTCCWEMEGRLQQRRGGPHCWYTRRLPIALMQNWQKIKRFLKRKQSTLTRKYKELIRPHFSWVLLWHWTGTEKMNKKRRT